MNTSAVLVIFCFDLVTVHSLGILIRSKAASVILFQQLTFCFSFCLPRGCMVITVINHGIGLTLLIVRRNIGRDRVASSPLRQTMLLVRDPLKDSLRDFLPLQSLTALRLPSTLEDYATFHPLCFHDTVYSTALRYRHAPDQFTRCMVRLHFDLTLPKRRFHRRLIWSFAEKLRTDPTSNIRLRR